MEADDVVIEVWSEKCSGKYPSISIFSSSRVCFEGHLVPVNPSPFKTVSTQSAVGLHGATLQPLRG
jgi:hypothetical protein